MSISPDLFDSVVPPAMWITLHELELAYQDDRRVTVRIKPFGRRSMTVKAQISRYSPEASVFRALAAFVEELHAAQTVLHKPDVQHALDMAISNYVEPF